MFRASQRDPARPELVGQAGETVEERRRCRLIWETCRVHLDPSAFICVHLWFQNSFGCPAVGPLVAASPRCVLCVRKETRHIRRLKFGCHPGESRGEGRGPYSRGRCLWAPAFAAVGFTQCTHLSCPGDWPKRTETRMDIGLFDRRPCCTDRSEFHASLNPLFRLGFLRCVHTTAAFAGVTKESKTVGLVSWPRRSTQSVGTLW
jgi:hypothetical protein